MNYMLTLSVIIVATVSPAKGQKTILISPMEQAQLMNELVTGKLPFSKNSLAVLKKLMVIQKTDME